MSGTTWSKLGLSLAACLVTASAMPAVVFETTSPYHHIRVGDSEGIRTMYFDDALETSISLRDPLQGHFEYTEYFHMPWLWNTGITSVLMIGLGGGSAQRSFEHFHPEVRIQTAELDAVVLEAAKNYFGFVESDRQRVAIEDGRMYLRRSRERYDLIVLDAYVQGRYGSSVPQHLATKEFFELARSHLTTNGVVAYNVIGTLSGYRADMIGAMYRTLKAVFPQVYLFPARTSLNTVMLATMATIKPERNALRQRAALLTVTGRITVPRFRERFEAFRDIPPPTAGRSPILTDDYAPVEGLAAGGGKGEGGVRK